MTIKDLDIVPKKPGVYIWKNKYDDVIYVGKAKNLNNRMKQYFKGMLNSYKTSKLVEKISSFEYVITNNEADALILERNLIEKHSPEYNILLTDDKRYPYIKVELRDKLEVTLAYRVRSSRNKKAIYFGPFPTGFGARKLSNLISRLTTYDKGLPIKNGDKEMWEVKYNYAKSLLTSNNASLVRELKQKMNLAAENLQFEIAQDIKETLKALEFFKDKQSVEINPSKNIDAIAFIEKDGFLSISMMFYRQGMLLSKINKIVEITSSKEESIRQYINQYYKYNVVPTEIYSNEDIETAIPVVVPQKGLKKKIVGAAIKNASDNVELKLQEFIRKEELTLGAMRKLEKLLKIEHISHLLMIDNSNTNNTQPVSAIVSYKNGIKQKSEYRKYNLVHNKRLADVDYMRQGVNRYLDGENKIPDLFILDGGLAQVNEVKDLITAPMIGLVKDDKHSTRAIVTREGEEIIIDDQNLMNFLKGIQIEVDRFAKMAHTRRRKTTLEGTLITIPGVGPLAEKKLLGHFKDYSSIYNASEEELSKVVSSKVAMAIKDKFAK